MFKEILLSKRYWLSVGFIAIGFIIVFSIIEHIMVYKGFSFDVFIQERLENGKWIRYGLSRIIGGLLYGMIMGYYFELRKKKTNHY